MGSPAGPLGSITLQSLGVSMRPGSPSSDLATHFHPTSPQVCPPGPGPHSGSKCRDPLCSACASPGWGVAIPLCSRWAHPKPHCLEDECESCPSGSPWQLLKDPQESTRVRALCSRPRGGTDVSFHTASRRRHPTSSAENPPPAGHSLPISSLGSVLAFAVGLGHCASPSPQGDRADLGTHPSTQSAETVTTMTQVCSKK